MLYEQSAKLQITYTDQAKMNELNLDRGLDLDLNL